MEPVDPNEAPDYYKVIKEPMGTGLRFTPLVVCFQFVAFRPSESGEQDQRADVQQAQRVHRRHDEDIRQLPVLQPEGVAVLQVRRVAGGVFRQQNPVLARKALRVKQII